MVTPETSGSDQPVRTRTGVIGIGLLGLVGGAIVVFSLTRPAQPVTGASTLPEVSSPAVAAPSTTTTNAPPSIEDIISGPQIEWIGRESFVGRRVVGALARGDSLYIFTTDLPEATGLDTWMPDDAGRWSHVAKWDISVFRPQAVVVAGDRFVAYGRDPHERLMVWSSPDGVRWERHELPPGGPTTSTWVVGAVGTDDLVVLAVEEWHDPVREAVAEHYPGFEGWLVPHGSDPGVMVEIDPLGIGFTVQPETIGLDPMKLAGDPTGTLAVYSGAPDTSPWQRVELATAERSLPTVNQILEGPDGRIWIVGSPPIASPDGVSWGPGIPIHLGVVTPWRERYVRLVESWNLNGSNRLPQVEVSDDLRTWQTLFRPALQAWPWCCMDWNFVSPPELAAGPPGVAYTARDLSVRTVTLDVPPLERDGYHLAPSEYGSALYRGDDLIMSYEDWWTDADGRVVRIENGAVVFLDPVTGEALVAFGVDELRTYANQVMYATRRIATDETHLLFYSPDGENWTTQDITGLLAADAHPRLVIGQDRILLVGEQPNVAEVWTGVLPPRP